MTAKSKTIDVYLEAGSKRTIAGALDWPGWCRVGRDADSALEALMLYAPRYARAVAPARQGFHPPADASGLAVAERLEGNATTDFGVPGMALKHDARPVDDDDLKRLQSLLKACWKSFDAAAEATANATLSKGPRGGGRDHTKLLLHVLNAEHGYIKSLGVKAPTVDEDDLPAAFELVREAALDALAQAARGETPKRGPRGGVMWAPRYFVRRVAWHVLDHAWELEDRAG